MILAFGAYVGFNLCLCAETGKDDCWFFDELVSQDLHVNYF